MQVNWDNIFDTRPYGKPITLPNLGRVLLWSSSDLFEINTTEQYHIRILGCVLDQIYDIPIDPALQQQQIAAIQAADYANTPPYQPWPRLL